MQQNSAAKYFERVKLVLRTIHNVTLLEIKSKQMENNSAQIKAQKKLASEARFNYEKKREENERLKSEAKESAKIMTAEEKEARKRPVNELEDELAENRARADAVTGFDPNIAQEYVNREKE
ncbi:hypothetical protein HK096_010652, partial [Nowakowskiella sp. JEL0078]